MQRTSKTAPLRVVSYNILAQAYVRPGRYPRSSPAALDRRARRARLLTQLADLSADVYCLQEVEPDAHEAIAAHLGDAYRGAFEAKRGRPDGCSIFARVDRVAIERVDALHYAAHDPGDDQLALIAALRCDAGAVAVASTHLRWQPDATPPERHLGRLQLIELLDHREARLAALPVWVIAGDLNATSQSAVVSAALDRGLALSCRSQRPWDTCNINGRRRKLDYLLYAPGSLEPRPGALPKLGRDTPMPSETHPSDHLPLAVDFAWPSGA
jgi:mRNA deadenylase 3'-5' endonuclease subunit Ccr4